MTSKMLVQHVSEGPLLAKRNFGIKDIVYDFVLLHLATKVALKVAMMSPTSKCKTKAKKCQEICYVINAYDNSTNSLNKFVSNNTKEH